MCTKCRHSRPRKDNKSQFLEQEEAKTYFIINKSRFSKCRQNSETTLDMLCYTEGDLTQKIKDKGVGKSGGQRARESGSRVWRSLRRTWRAGSPTTLPPSTNPLDALLPVLPTSQGAKNSQTSGLCSTRLRDSQAVPNCRRASPWVWVQPVTTWGSAPRIRFHSVQRWRDFCL